MAIPNPDHLFDQADKLISPGLAGPPRQTDLRRAIAAACYGLFHTCLIAAADEFAGVVHRATVRYSLVYRSVDHRTLREVCGEAKKATPSTRYAAYIPSGGFDQQIRSFSGTAIDLQGRRHTADYDPYPALNRRDARIALIAAQGAVRQFAMAAAEHRKLFLTLLVCPPR